MKLSVVVPVYGAPKTLKSLYAALMTAIKKMGCEYEIIFVNDACPRHSWAAILEITSEDKNVKGINLVKNFGQHAAIACGLEKSTGDWVTVMDCDLQDDPEYLDVLLQEAAKGFDVVLARRDVRLESWFKRFQSWILYKALHHIIGVKMDHRVGNFGVYSRRVIDSVNGLSDRVRIFPILISWFEYPSSHVSITQQRRHEGRSSYTLSKALRLAFDLAISVSTKPLIWSVQLGALCGISSFLLGSLFIARFFLLGLAPSGWTSLSVGVFFSTGIILFNLGILGLYVARIYDQVRQRPVYHVKSTVNL